MLAPFPLKPVLPGRSPRRGVPPDVLGLRPAAPPGAHPLAFTAVALRVAGIPALNERVS